MTIGNSQTWYYVEVTLIDSNANTHVYNLSDRPINTGTYYGILKDITGIGSRMGEVLPQSQTGIITIDCSHSSFGFERRFCDLFERYSPIDQQVIVYGAITDSADDDPTGDWDQLFKAKIRDYTIYPDRGTCDLNIDSAVLQKRDVTQVIDITEFPDAPSSSIGKNIPLVFGDLVEVVPIQIDDSATSPDWAYGTNFGGQFVNYGVDQYYAKDFSGRYVEVQNPASTSTKMFGTTPATPTDGGQPISPDYEIAQLFNATDGGIITTCTFEWYNVSGAAHSSEEIIITIYAANGDKFDVSGQEAALPGTVLGSARFIPSASGAGSKSSQASFNQPVILETGEDYYFGITRRSSTPSDTSIDFSRNTVYTSVNSYRRWFASTLGGSTAPTAWAITALTLGNFLLELFGVRFLDIPGSAGIDSSGLSHSYFTASQRSAASLQYNPDLSRLDLLVAVDGICDDVSGSITGNPSSIMITPKSILQLLDYRWDGAAWVEGAIDATLYSDTHDQISNVSGQYVRNCEGKTEGLTSWESLVNEICKNSAVRIGLVNSTTSDKFLGIYGWGVNHAATYTITDEDCELLSIEQRGTESIVNHVRMYYDNRVRNSDLSKITAEGNFSQYAATLDWYNGANDTADLLAEESATVYGDRLNKEFGFKFVQSSGSAEVIANYFLSTFAKPHWYVEFTTELFKYKDIELLDVVELLHPAIPAFFGTSPNARYPEYNGTAVDIVSGHYWKRARRVRVQIEARQLDLRFPKIRFAGRILDNYPNDPT